MNGSEIGVVSKINVKKELEEEVSEEEEDEEEVDTSINFNGTSIKSEKSFAPFNSSIPPRSHNIPHFESGDGSDSTISFTNTRKRPCTEQIERNAGVDDESLVRCPVDTEHEAQLMAASYVPCLRRLQPKQRMLVDIQIKKILFEAEYPRDREIQFLFHPPVEGAIMPNI